MPLQASWQYPSHLIHLTVPFWDTITPSTICPSIPFKGKPGKGFIGLILVHQALAQFMLYLVRRLSFRPHREIDAANNPSPRREVTSLLSGACRSPSPGYGRREGTSRYVSNFQEKTYMSIKTPTAPAGLENPAGSYAFIKFRVFRIRGLRIAWKRNLPTFLASILPIQLFPVDAEDKLL